MKKQFRKVVCLAILLSMVMGLGGCAMMYQGVKKQDVREELPEGWEEAPDPTPTPDMQYETNALMALLQQKQEEMNERLEFYHVSVSDTVEGKLADLRSECAVMINGDPEAE